MDNCNRRIFCSVTATIVLMLPPVMLEKIDGKIDVIVVLQYAHTTRDEKYEIKAYKKLAELFEFGEGRAKFGIVFETTKSVRQSGKTESVHWLLLNLTATPAVFNEQLDSYGKHPHPVLSTYLGPGGKWMPVDSIHMLKNLHKLVFPTTQNRRRAVFYIATTPPANASDKDLRDTRDELDNSAIFPFMYVPNLIDEADNSNPYRVAKFLIQRSKIFVSPGPDYDARLAEDVVKNIGSNLLGHVCQMWYDPPCYYEDKNGTRCKIDARQLSSQYPYANNRKQCDEAPTAYPCTATICMEDCDAKWPLDQKPDCTGQCGNVPYQGTPPAKLQNCPPTSFSCRPCSTAPELRFWTDTSVIIAGVVAVSLFVIIVTIVTVILMKKERPRKGLAKSATAKGRKKSLAKKKRASKMDLEEGEGTLSKMSSDSGRASPDADLERKKGKTGKKKKTKTATKKGKDIGKKKGSVAKKKGLQLKRKGSEVKKTKKKKK